VNGRVRRLVARVDAATPPGRDRAVDALRALAITGVIGGHWLVTALVPGPASGHGGGTVLHDASPLSSMPALAPVSWIFQTLSVFFLVGGYSAARGYRGGYLSWLRGRMVRLARPVAVLAAVWIPVTACLCLAGVPWATVRTLLTLVISPLWFLGVYAGLTALTPVAVRLAGRLGGSGRRSPRRSWPPPTWCGSAWAGRPGWAGSTCRLAGWSRTCSGRRGRAARCAAGAVPRSCWPAVSRPPRRSSPGLDTRPAWSA
jgi:Acyltransferase family